MKLDLVVDYKHVYKFCMQLFCMLKITSLVTFETFVLCLVTMGYWKSKQKKFHMRQMG